jgi:hypothetical protein
MKTNRFIIATVLLLLCTLYAGASDFKVDGLYYNVIYGTDNNVGVTYPDYPETYEGVITIPATVSWEGKLYQVTRISSRAFSERGKPTAITVDNDNPLFSSSDGVLFDKEKTRLIAYPAGKTETAYAIPGSVKTIGERAFYRSYLISVNIPDGVKTIESEAFWSCDNLSSIVIPNSVTSIGGYAFSNCTSLETVSLPNSLRTIEHYAFCNCKITSVKIPNAVTSLSGSAFARCPLFTSVSIDHDNPNYTTEDGILYSKDKTRLILYPGGKPATTFIVPNTVKVIGDAVFDSNKTLTSVILPDGLETIRSYAFRARIESIVLPNTLRKIGYAAFEQSYIKSITIPASVESVEEWAFTKCPYLTSIVFEGPVQSMGGFVFAGYIHSPPSYTMEVKCEPFKIDESLEHVDVKNSILIVPYGMKGFFLAAAGWQDFGTIIEKSGVSNEAPVAEAGPKVYISGGMLHIETPRSETVQIYSITGGLAGQFTKPAGSISYPVLPAHGRLLIVKGSSGWVKKVMAQTKR